MNDHQGLSEKIRLPRGAQAALLILLPVGFYCFALDAYFTGEDFGTLRILSQGSWLKTILTQFVSPFAQLADVKFYRPVASSLLVLEFKIFHAGAFTFHVAHLLIHVLNAFLVWRCIEVMIPEHKGGLPFCAALLFALHPLQPNAVLKVSSYATLFCITFLLGSLLLFLEFRKHGNRGAYITSLVLFVLALGSYEAAAVFPLVLLGFDLIVPDPNQEKRTLRKSVKIHALYIVLIPLYVLLRKLLMGEFMGGYEGMRDRLFTWPPEWTGDMLDSFVLLLYPSFEGGEWNLESRWIGVALALLVVIGLFARFFSRERLYSSLFIVGLIWFLLSQASFFFTPVLPVNGRYAYLTSIGLVLGLLAAVRMLSSLVKLPRGLLTGAATAVLVVLWAGPLWTNLAKCAEAGRLTHVIQKRIFQRALKADPKTRFFIMGHPRFVLGESGVPYALVYPWGLNDALRPPFTGRMVPVFPLPAVDEAGLIPLATIKDPVQVLLWDKEKEAFVPVPITPLFEQSKEVLERILLKSPADRARLPRDPSQWNVVSRCGKYPKAEVIVVSAGIAVRQPVPASENEEWITVQLPPRLEVASFYDEDILWWVVGRDAKGKVEAVSRPRRFRIDGSVK